MSSLKVEAATPTDTEVVIEILCDATRWLQSRALPTWDPALLHAVIEPAVKRGEVYLARLDNQPVGTVSVQWSDAVYWGEQPDDAGYIHKLAVARSVAGQGVGMQLLAWAEWFIVERGRRFARLDCHADNPTINRIYQSEGYQKRGSLTLNNVHMNIYEKLLSDVTLP